MPNNLAESLVRSDYCCVSLAVGTSLAVLDKYSGEHRELTYASKERPFHAVGHDQTVATAPDGADAQPQCCSNSGTQ